MGWTVNWLVSSRRRACSQFPSVICQLCYSSTQDVVCMWRPKLCKCDPMTQKLNFRLMHKHKVLSKKEKKRCQRPLQDCNKHNQLNQMIGCKLVRSLSVLSLRMTGVLTSQRDIYCYQYSLVSMQDIEKLASSSCGAKHVYVRSCDERADWKGW